MAENCEKTMKHLNKNDFTMHTYTVLTKNLTEVVQLFNRDAYFAAQSIHIHVFKPIKVSIRDHFSEIDWEDMTENEGKQSSKQ